MDFAIISYLLMIILDMLCYFLWFTNQKPSIIFVRIKKAVESHFGTTIKFFQSNSGKEYVNKTFVSFLTSHGIQYRQSYLHTPQQNDVAERKHPRIVETGLSLVCIRHLCHHSFGWKHFLPLFLFFFFFYQ